MIKRCLRCGRKFEEKEAFVTCPTCRVPVNNQYVSGGCRRWDYVDVSPKITEVKRSGNDYRDTIK